jgi:hypothetical protein
MIENMPIVIPRRERNVRNLFAESECHANLKLSIISVPKNNLFV